MTIRNPAEWSIDQARLLRLAGAAVGSASRAVAGAVAERDAPAPKVRRIGRADIAAALAKGLDDFAAYRTDVVFICIAYPIIGLVLARLAFGYDMLPLLFPLASGFAIIGPFAALGLYEMSRLREREARVELKDALSVVRAPAFGAIMALGLLLVGIFLLWLGAAALIYALTLGPAPPVSTGAFARDIFTTGAGWAMIAAGMGAGFLFALLAMSISVVSFPLLLDRNVTLRAAIGTSLRVMGENPGAMAAWGLIVAAGLALGSLPLFAGLIVVMPVLGHATWHLYRRVVAG